MITLGSNTLSQSAIIDIVFFASDFSIDNKAQKNIEQCYNLVLQCAQAKTPLYGINTGFGALAEQSVAPVDQLVLQKNLILSHAVGVGQPLDFFTSKTLMLLRLNTLLQGYSGASPQLIKNLRALLLANIAPFVPKKGSVGASGDLAPLAHLGLLLLGIGEAYVDHKLTTAKLALKSAGIDELRLGVRDGLALINGTQAMTANAVTALWQIKSLSNLADIAAASTLDALGGHESPFDPRIHELKPHPGQVKTAKNILAAIAGRTVVNNIKNKLTQDPYSLRCVPQVHGACKDVIEHVCGVVDREINSVTDNPLFFHDEKANKFDILSGGNFHGQHMAFALDYLALAVAELASISERRIELLLNPNHSNGLPAFLVQNSGLNSGYMMLHVTASALVNENKVQCTPASIDSIPTSASREDHVSMGMTSANKLWRIVHNTKTVLAIELLAANQALDLRPIKCAGLGVVSLHRALRNIVPMRQNDGLYRDDLIQTLSWLELDQTKKFIAQLLDG